MPICDFGLKIASKVLTTRHFQRSNIHPKSTSLGTHLRNRLLLDGQTQRQSATQLDVIREVYDRWERDETEPPVGFWKRIIAFLLAENGLSGSDLAQTLIPVVPRSRVPTLRQCDGSLPPPQ